MAGKPRVQIRPYMMRELQQEVHSVCPFCESTDVAHFEFHHIDGDRSNSVFENLIMLCQPCHSRFTKGIWPPEKARQVKERLLGGSNYRRPRSQLKGIVKYQNSHDRPAAGIRVFAFGASETTTDDFGAFELEFENLRPGDRVWLSVNGHAPNGDSIEIVNTEQLKILRMPSRPEEDIVEVVISTRSERVESIEHHKDVLTRSLQNEFDRRLEILQEKIQNRQFDASILNELSSLKEVYEKTLEKVPEVATRIASIDADSASSTVRDALEQVRDASDIDQALKLLAPDRLQNWFKQVEVARKATDLELKQVMEAYSLRADLLMTRFEFGSALECCRRIIEILESNFWNEAELLGWYHKAAWVSYLRGDYLESRSYYASAISIAEDLPDFDERYLSSLYNGMALTLIDLAEYDEALAFQTKAVLLSERIQDPNLAARYDVIGVIHRFKANYVQALNYQSKAVSIKEQALDPGDVSLGMTYDNIATTYGVLGHYDRSLEYQKKSFAIMVDKLDLTDPRLATAHNNMGHAHLAVGQFDDALPYLEKAVAIEEKSPGRNPSDLATMYEQMGIAHFHLKKLESALEDHERALDIRLRVFGERHHYVASSYCNLGSVYSDLGDHDTAMKVSQAALKIRRDTLGDEHPDVGKSYNNIGAIFFAQKQYAKALQYQLLAVKNFEKSFGSEGHPQLISVYYDIGQTFYFLKDHQNALEYFLKSRAMHEQLLSEENIGSARCCLYVGITYEALSDYKLSVEWLTRAVEVLLQVREQYPEQLEVAEQRLERAKGFLGSVE